MMMKYSAIILLSFLSSIAHGQECSQLLKQGIYDISSNSTDLSTTSSFAQWFCDEKFSSSQEADNFGASLGFPFKGVPVKLGFDSGSESWGESYSRFCANYKNDSSLKLKLRNHVKTASGTIVNAFNTCIASRGLHVWLERTYDPRVFKFAARFNPPNKNNPVAVFQTFDEGTNVSCRPRPSEVDSSEFRSRCTRKDDNPVTLIVNADWAPVGGGDLSLPAIAKYKASPKPTIHKKNPLYLGLTPKCNAGIITNHQNHLNCTNNPYGYTISHGSKAFHQLYLGISPNINAGVVTTKSNFKGGATQPYGFTIRDDSKPKNAKPLYVVVGCGVNDGEVTNHSGHKNCPTQRIGWVYPW